VTALKKVVPPIRQLFLSHDAEAGTRERVSFFTNRLLSERMHDMKHANSFLLRGGGTRLAPDSARSQCEGRKNPLSLDG
jgi:DNA topoisomerase IB